MNESWLTQPERGSTLLMQLLTWLTLRLGRPVGRLLLYPICLYFTVFSRRTRRASRRYLQRVLGRHAGWRDIFRHYHAFASTIHDRIYLLSGRHRYFEIRVQGDAVLEALVKQGRGCILLGSHLGSFEILRVYGTVDKKLPINVLMLEGTTAKLDSVLHALNPGMKPRIIPLGTPETMIRVKERLDQGELVGILGDRSLPTEKVVTCRFLGGEAWFPEGPLLLAAMLKAPVVLFFGLYRGNRRYDIHFELLAEHITLDPDNRSEQLRPWIERYAARIEHYSRLAPFNWFNFYEFSPDLS
jgi:predicted LPLAT superfamily acyltransferase